MQHNWPRRHYADGPFGQVHFQETGEGPALLMFHQAPMTSGQFDNVYAPLAARGYRAIGIDMPGFGMSDPTPDTPTVTDYAQVIPAVLGALGIERAALLGHHTGALAATEGALLFPDRIAALIVNGPLLVSAADRQNFLDNLHQWELGYHAREHAGHMAELFDIRNNLASGTIPHARLSDYVVQALIGRGAFWYGHNAAYMYDQEPQLAQVKQPTLILSNTGDMIFDHAQRASELFPHFGFAALEGGGVDIVDQQPEAWADEVAKFLRGAGWQ
ncbi:hypothetical protein NRB_22930 [Novosphingobium sp. 11B]|uniref:Alpha/beta hydrolase n=1 Tax=Novosphingobium resinovorum TaxID=158500 RepID=A0A031JUP5_9SPHN|nr:alpha/beta hydrolase [Novosphingobium resinovorum]AOR79526.1 alpha/beta hydrolase [Novosphingobium resinovorum]EZP80523.1 putative hydrolase or acyltransferase of alpha/beta superfamily protein [Novosphingobium resinovorum]